MYIYKTCNVTCKNSLLIIVLASKIHINIIFNMHSYICFLIITRSCFSLPRKLTRRKHQSLNKTITAALTLKLYFFK